MPTPPAPMNRRDWLGSPDRASFLMLEYAVIPAHALTAAT